MVMMAIAMLIERKICEHNGSQYVWLKAAWFSPWLESQLLIVSRVVSISTSFVVLLSSHYMPLPSFVRIRAGKKNATTYYIIIIL